MSWGYTIIRIDGMAFARAAGTWRGDEMNLQLNGKMAVVTGSTAGIGFAIATLLAREEAHVVVNGRSAERVAGAVSRIRDEVGGWAESSD
jgi:short chain dehydrogenase